jgi:hypothetical protein
VEETLSTNKHAYQTLLLPGGMKKRKTALLFKTFCEAIILFFSQARFQETCGDLALPNIFRPLANHVRSKSLWKEILLLQGLRDI